jgi:dihydroflavonol-4-reductase
LEGGDIDVNGGAIRDPETVVPARLSPADRVLVTGASGFLGSAVARAVLAAGARLRVLVRPGSPRGNLVGLDCEVSVGDLTEPATLPQALRGISALFHVAADYRLWTPDPEAVLRANVEGTRSLMRAALAAGVSRIVHTSSVATLRVAGAHGLVDEVARQEPADAIGAYKRSKILAERGVEEMIRREGLPAVIVLPSTPVGPRDIRPTPTGRMVLDAARGRIPAFIDTGLNLAHVDDVAQGHLFAYERGQVGGRYILGGENMSLRDILQAIADLAGCRAPRLRLPRTPLHPLALAAEAIARMTGREPLLTRDALRMARHPMYFTTARAERDLGYRARPAREGLADALAWFRREGYLR